MSSAIIIVHTSMQTLLKYYSETLLFLPLSRIHNSIWVVCKQVEVLQVFLFNAYWPEMARPHVEAKVINYMLFEDHSQAFNEELFLLYCKLYNKCI